MDTLKAIFNSNYDNMDNILNLMYYASPPIYDFFMKIENASQPEFAKAMSILSKEIGATVSEAEIVEFYYNNMDISEFNKTKNEFISNIKQQSFNIIANGAETKDYLDILNDKNMPASKFIKEEYLSANELIEINDNLVKQVNDSENVDVILEAFNIDIYSYKAEKGYKLFFNKDGAEQVLKVYYMNGDWRITN